MGKLALALAYLCGCGCIEPTDDTSQFKSRAKEDPREQMIDAEFMARNYTRDASGHFHMTPTPSMLRDKTSSTQGTSSLSPPAMSPMTSKESRPPSREKATPNLE
ncbi:hypothetical protein CC1G_04594 [Coprinopsis cinerea okayama7|uniref:Uncharacterized protein n=1 Tax=Coprinopsis cinerea (strain Okayama-7 / 130 / ATCC MYA-4618 / FGSC 9003) TaxID=240176 RepID=A8N516_COPC7|nr:hypothetical protein CC1G_04594 [Coprinopsis cinerea okayama7\|eukprot:XP_001829905.1 hypothetical protein CC1G_04594 [Coprinopsis cinerea okayama7\